MHPTMSLQPFGHFKRILKIYLGKEVDLEACSLVCLWLAVVQIVAHRQHKL